MTINPLPAPGPERRAELEARGMRVGVSDFTADELAGDLRETGKILDALGITGTTSSDD